MPNHQRSLIGQHDTGGASVHFWAVTCYFNPCRYENRFRNYMEFKSRLRAQRVQLLTIELCTTAEAAHLRKGVSDKYVCVVESDVLWAKERLLNIALDHLPRECREVCWCDCDIVFEWDRWATACSSLLKKHRIVQPWATAVFMGPGETIEKLKKTAGRFRPSTSFALAYVKNNGSLVDSEVLLKAHPGYAWAARRDVLRRIGGFYDHAVLGHGDIVMALGFSHSERRDGPVRWPQHWNPGWSDVLKEDALEWQRRASHIVDGDVASLGGTIYHMWHGPKRNRAYDTRGTALQQFDPCIHLELGVPSNMWKWTKAARDLGIDKSCKRYFKSRQEDDQREI